MKVQLVVVRGKPEGKVIPLASQTFKIGRGETCHLRPNSEQVSREHAEFTLGDESIHVRDLGSRNGTLVNGKALTSEPCRLKDRDLVQVGPLTFAVAILDATAASKPLVGSAPAAKGSPDDISVDEIDSWLGGPTSTVSADAPTAVYGGDTITISAFKDASVTVPKPATPPSASDDEYERQPDDEEQVPFESENNDEDDDESSGEELGATVQDAPEEFIDESNPFYAAKKALQAKEAAGPAKASFKDTSDAAGDILRRLMERRRQERG